MDFEILQEHLNLLFERMTLFTALLKFSLFVDVGQTYKNRNKKEEGTSKNCNHSSNLPLTIPNSYLSNYQALTCHHNPI
jgi:hypothetical protein